MDGGLIITVAVFTAGVVTTATRKLEGMVREVDDLDAGAGWRHRRLGDNGYLLANRIHYQGYANAEEGLTALQSGTIDAFVYDKPLLAWTVLQRFSSTVEVLEMDFDPPIMQRRSSPAARFGSRSISRCSRRSRAWWKQTLFGIWE